MKNNWTIALLVPLLTACVSSRDLTYMNEGDLPQSVTISRDILSAGDELLIRVAAVDERTVELFNVQPIEGEDGHSSNYRIGEDGTISMPSLGKIHLAGMSQLAAQDTLIALISRRVKEPMVLLKRVNAYITILGEVHAPGRYKLEGDITLLDALGLAGDLTVNGNRQNIQVIRIENGHTTEWRVNLHDKQLLVSPAFALRKGDIIYVSPRYGRTINKSYGYSRNY